MDIEQFFKEIYYGQAYLSRENPDTEEYKEVSEKTNQLSHSILKHQEIKDIFIEYNENMSIKESLEAEKQFEVGFKTAVKLILFGMK